MQSCWSPFLNIGIILACLRILGNSPVEKDKLIRFANGFERSFLNCFRMIVGILPGPTALWTLRVLIGASISSGNIGKRKNDFSDCLFKYKSKVLVVFGIFHIWYYHIKALKTIRGSLEAAFELTKVFRCSMVLRS